jgi:hypothetical protein
MLLPQDTDGYVYLAHADTGHFKVGRSIEPEKRIKHFDTQMPVDVSEWHFFRADDYKEAEDKLHDVCDEHGEHEKGEWWDLPEYLVWWIKSIAAYKDGNFYGTDDLSTPIEEPSESYANFEQLFGWRTHRSSPPVNSAFPHHG